MTTRRRWAAHALGTALPAGTLAGCGAGSAPHAARTAGSSAAGPGHHRSAATGPLRAGTIPPLLDRHDVYAAERPGLLAPAARGVPARVYVPNSESATVDVISQATGKIVGHFAVGRLPQHVTPSWDLRTLWVTNDEGNTLTPIDPRTSKPAARSR